nr:dipeptidase [Bryobacter sp.]
HNDYPLSLLNGRPFGTRSTEGHTDLPRMKQGGVGAQFFAAFVAGSFADRNQSAHQALELIDAIKRDIIAANAAEVAFATSPDEILAANKAGKIAILIGIEGGHAIEDSPRLLRQFHELGVRYMTLTHTNTNNWADSSGDLNRPNVKHHNGLTPLGKQIILEMNRLGMIVDVAHVSDKTFWDVLETSKSPFFSSHSSCRAIANVGRNMTDEMIQAMAKKGGLIQINLSCDFLSQKSADASPMNNPAAMGQFMKLMEIKDPQERRSAMRKLRESLPPMPRATLDDVVAHIDHVVKIAGIDHVGIGSDFDGISCTPEGLDDVSRFPNLTRRLLEKGYTPAQIRKIYSGNMLRLMRDVEAAAKKLKAS